jgi:RNA polymerase sigma-B factor
LCRFQARPHADVAPWPEHEGGELMGSITRGQPNQTPSDQELVRVVQSRSPDDPERDAACEKLIIRHSSIVRSCVQRYPRYPEPEDLMQVGYVGLLKAINNFDPAVGDKLAAYAQPCVSGEIKRYFRDKRWGLRVQRQEQELRLAMRAAAAELTQRLARNPRADELAAHLGVTQPEINAAQAASQVFQIASLDAPLLAAEESSQLSDLVGGEDPGLERAIDMASVWKHCDELPRRQQRLLMMRFYGNMTQAQIGKELGISQMHVSRLLDRALTYLRDKVAGSQTNPA